MSALANQEPVGQVDPRDLTQAELQALQLIDTQRLHRARNGWRGVGKAAVTLAMVERLQLRRLAARKLVNGQWRLEVTGAGRNTLAVAEQRRRG